MTQQPSQPKAALSGPISKGDQSVNLRAFQVARSVLESERSFAVVHSPHLNPKAREAARESAHLIRHGGGDLYKCGPLYREAVRWYTLRILDADTLFMLPGWIDSNGARYEAFLAEQCGIDVRAWDPRRDGRESINVRTTLKLMTFTEIDAVHSDGFRRSA